MYFRSEVLSAGSEAPSAGSEALWDSLGALAARSEALSAGSKVLKANFEVLSVGFKEPRASQLALWRQGPHSGHGGPTSWLQAGSWHRGSPSWIGGLWILKGGRNWLVPPLQKGIFKICTTTAEWLVFGKCGALLTFYTFFMNIIFIKRWYYIRLVVNWNVKRELMTKSAKNYWPMARKSRKNH